jgi:hypothetical protein
MPQPASPVVQPEGFTHEEVVFPVGAGSVDVVVVVVVVVLFSVETPRRFVQKAVIQVQASFHRLCWATGAPVDGVLNKLAA